jgi:hypothetical protein
MRVRITAIDGYTEHVPKTDPRFSWLPPTEEDLAQRSPREWVEANHARVYTDLETLDDLVALARQYGPLELHVRDAGESDTGILEVMINHDCYSA